MFNDFWIPMIYLGISEQTLAKVYELEGRILAQRCSFKKGAKNLLLFLKTEVIPIALANFKCWNLGLE